MNDLKKEEDLRVLLRFCQQKNVSGWCANIWYNGLITRYPFHYLVYAQFNKEDEWRKDKVKKNIKENIIQRLDYILVNPVESDGKLYQLLIKELDEVIRKRKMQIKK